MASRKRSAAQMTQSAVVPTAPTGTPPAAPAFKRRFQPRTQKKKTVYRARKGTYAYARKIAEKAGPEVKHAGGLWAYSTLVNGYTSGGVYTAPTTITVGQEALEAIVQGTSQKHRIGNRIVLKDFWVTLDVHLNRDCNEPGGTTNANTGTFTRPTHIRLYLAYPKDEDSQADDLASTDFGDFYQNGADAYALSGMPPYLHMRLNTDKWRILRYWDADIIPLTTGQYAYEDTHDRYDTVFTAKANLAKYLPSILTYDDAEAQPTNGRNFYFFIDAYPLGTIIPQAGTTIGTPIEARITTVQEVTYMDP